MDAPEISPSRRDVRRTPSRMLTRVLASGERFPLAMAGNHAQGTLFRNGAHLITPALEKRIDEIARAYPGFYIGRFDIRYTDVEAFKAGRDLAIVELNGATGESTNIYDPDGSSVPRLPSPVPAMGPRLHDWRRQSCDRCAGELRGKAPRARSCALTMPVVFPVSD